MEDWKTKETKVRKGVEVKKYKDGIEMEWRNGEEVTGWRQRGVERLISVAKMWLRKRAAEVETEMWRAVEVEKRRKGIYWRNGGCLLRKRVKI